MRVKEEYHVNISIRVAILENMDDDDDDDNDDVTSIELGKLLESIRKLQSKRRRKEEA
jgi:hypothetical protein